MDTTLPETSSAGAGPGPVKGSKKPKETQGLKDATLKTLGELGKLRETISIPAQSHPVQPSDTEGAGDPGTGPVPVPDPVEPGTVTNRYVSKFTEDLTALKPDSVTRPRVSESTKSFSAKVAPLLGTRDAILKAATAARSELQKKTKGTKMNLSAAEQDGASDGRGTKTSDRGALLETIRTRLPGQSITQTSSTPHSPSLENGVVKPLARHPNEHIFEAWDHARTWTHNLARACVSTVVGFHYALHYGHKGVKETEHWAGAILVLLLAMTSFLATLAAAGSLAIIIAPWAPVGTPDFIQHEFYYLQIKLPQPVTLISGMHNSFQLGPFGNALGDREAGSITSYPSRARPTAPNPTSYLLDEAQIWDVATSLFESVIGDITSAVVSEFSVVTSDAVSIATGVASTVVDGATNAATQIVNAGQQIGSAFGFRKRDLEAVMLELSRYADLADPKLRATVPGLDSTHSKEGDAPAADILQKRDFIGSMQDIGGAAKTTFTGIGNEALQAMKNLLKTVEEAFEKLLAGFDELRAKLAKKQHYIQVFNYALLSLLAALGSLIFLTIAVYLHWALRSCAKLENKKRESQCCKSHCPGWCWKCCCFCGWRPNEGTPPKGHRQERLLSRAHGHNLLGLGCQACHILITVALGVLLIPAIVFAAVWVVVGIIVTMTNTVLRALPLPPPYDFSLSVSRYTLISAVATGLGILIAIVTSPLVLSWAYRYVLFVLTTPFRLVRRVLKITFYPCGKSRDGCHDVVQAFRDILYRFDEDKGRPWVKNKAWRPQRFGAAFRAIPKGFTMDVRRWIFNVSHCVPIFRNKCARGYNNILYVRTRFYHWIPCCCPSDRLRYPAWIEKEPLSEQEAEEERLQIAWERFEYLRYPHKRDPDRNRCQQLIACCCCRKSKLPTRRPRHNDRIWQTMDSRMFDDALEKLSPPKRPVSGEKPPSYEDATSENVGSRPPYDSSGPHDTVPSVGKALKSPRPDEGPDGLPGRSASVPAVPREDGIQGRAA